MSSGLRKIDEEAEHTRGLVQQHQLGIVQETDTHRGVLSVRIHVEVWSCCKGG